MVQHIGIVACSAEGAALCYRTICSQAPALMGEHHHPEISMHTPSLSQYMDCLRVDNWSGVADLMLESAKKLAAIGADFAICPDNTIHQAFDEVAASSPIPWLHIAEVVADKAAELGYRRLGITGTDYLMTGPVYPQALRRKGIDYCVPDEPNRAIIDTMIFKELVNGVFREQTRQQFNQIVARLKQQGCDAVVLGCTEIPLLVTSETCPLPTLDSTRLLAQAALNHAFDGT